MTQLSELLLGQKCRPSGVGPTTEQARPDDYFYTVVAVWLEPVTMGGARHELKCALVADNSGGTNILPFDTLEFSDLDLG